MMSDEPKPCPFCKNRSNIKLVEYRPNCSGAVVCGQCGARGPKKKNDHERGWRVKAIEAWNARAAATDEQFAVAVHDGEAWQKVRECRIDGVSGGRNCGTTTYRLSCGHVAVVPDGIRFEHCPSCGAKVVG